MNADTQMTFAAVCGAALSPGLRLSETGSPLTAARGGATALIYASCADHLGARVEAGETVSSALAGWIAEAGAVLTAYRSARADFFLIEQRLAWAAPGPVLAALAARAGGAADASALASAPADYGPVSRLIADHALSQSPKARDLEAELAAGGLAVTLTDEETARRQSSGGARDLDALADEIRREAPSATAHAALQAEAAQLRDMLDHAQGRKSADATRLAEQARKIEAQHNIIRRLERELGEAQGAVRQIQKWLQGAVAP